MHQSRKILQERLLNHPKIEVIWNHEVTAFLGDSEAAMPSLNAIRLQNRPDGKQQELAVDGCLWRLATVQRPSFLPIAARNGRRLSGHRSGSHRNQHSGVFAAGDVSDPIYRQAVTAAGMGRRLRLKPSASGASIALLAQIVQL